MVAAAVIGGAVVGAAGSAVAGSKAAKATKNASNAAITEQQQALAQQERLSAPYRQLGESAIPQLSNLLGISGSGTDALTTLRNTPGYQFARDEGLKAATNSATAQGLSLSGNTLEALDRYGTGLADQTYGSQVARLTGVVDTGQAAAAGQAANVGTAAGNISGTLVNQGNTAAGINANTIAGITKAIGGGFDQYGQAQTLAGLTNPGGFDPGYSDAYISANVGYPTPLPIMGGP